MLKDIHNALVQLVYTYGRIDPLDVDVRFDIPDEEWVSSLTRPTISFFLFDVQENTEKRETSMQTLRESGKAQRRMPPRRIDLYYLASVLTAEVEDEHQLLWRLLATLMKHQQFPAAALPNSLKSLDPGIVTRVERQHEGGNLLEIWNALGSRPHPALCYVVTAPLDLEVAFEVPLILTRTARYKTMDRVGESDRIGIQIGGVVRDKIGKPLPDITVKIGAGGEGATTNAAGQYVLHGVPAGPVNLSVLEQGGVEKRVEVQIPSESYDIFLDR